MVLGLHYLTKVPYDFADRIEKAQRYSSVHEVELAIANGCFVKQGGAIDHHAPVYFRFQDEWLPTTVGRVLFNDIIPDELGFVNETVGKGTASELVFQCFRRAGLSRTTEFLDQLKDFGFKYATVGGTSIGIEDLEIPPQKADIIASARADTDRFTKAYEKGVISNGERYNRVIDAWTHANNDVAEAMIGGLAKSRGGLNPVHMMFDSGSRGSRDQIRQLAGMRGLMAKPQKKLTGGIGEIIESPILSNFREGLTVLEYFISTHGARKGLADTALKTADAGYLTRRLVDVAQDVTISEEDCGTVLGLEVSALKEGEDIIEPLRDRIVGTVALEEVVDPIDGQRLLKAGEMIDEEASQAVEEAGIQSVRIRSVLTCESRRGICRQCYGRNPATMNIVDLGEAVGIIAAQSIGEPGTQLTLRTFHIGGTAARIAAQTQRKSKVDGTIKFDRVTWVEGADGKTIVTSREGEIQMLTADGQIRSRLTVPYGATLHVEDEQEAKISELLFSWDPYSEPIVADVKGAIAFQDIVEEETVREELDESTGRRQLTIIEDREKKLHPQINITDGGEKVREFIVPVGAQLVVRDGKKVQPGDTLAKISREVYKTRDITGGLPRVAELFEARRPKDPATIAEVDGTVSFRAIKRGKREVVVTSDSGEEQVYEIQVGKHLRVHEGDRVRAGDRLSEGPVNPHDILRVKGPRAVQEYLLNEIQEVYRLQGVRISDMHIGVIVRQMLQKVRIADPGNTELLEGEHVDRVEFLDTNAKMRHAGKKPARAEPLLLGITKASLTTQSFISAASFQETTRVLTDAAVRGARDDLQGLKENIIIGHLVPAGTGIHRYHDTEFLVEGASIEQEISQLASTQAEAEEVEVEVSLADLMKGVKPTAGPAEGAGD
jgi:DNA-directed RNA polymerase subunit beta'